MPKTYELAAPEVSERAIELIEKYHKDLHAVGVKIDILFARSDTGHAVSHGGYQALAVVRALGLKDRAAGRGDAEIVLDAIAYEAMQNAQRDALLDHELYHLVVKRDDIGAYDYDDLHRPKLYLRKHDHQFGWFSEIARRHGNNSTEVYQARKLIESDGQTFFPGFAEYIHA